MRRIVVLLFIPLYLIISIPLMPFALIARLFSRNLSRRIAYLFARTMSILLMYLIGGKFIVTGTHNIDPDQNYLFVSNHRSLLDTPSLCKYVKAPLSFISKEEMKKAPILSQWMMLLQCLFINRKNTREALKTILRGIEQMKMGDNMAIFPQGTRSVGDDFLKFKAGSFKLATKSGVPIIPVAISGTDNILENNVFNVKVSNVYMRFFEPIETKDLTADQLKALPAEVEAMIHEQFEIYQNLE